MTSHPALDPILHREIPIPSQSEASPAFERLCNLIVYLRREVSSPWLLGSSLLHPRHPIPSEQLTLMQTLNNLNESHSPSLYLLFRKVALSIFSAIYDTVFLIALKLFWGKTWRHMRLKNVEVLFKTWCTNPDLLDKPSDFYFGTLHSDFAQRSISSLFLCGDGRSDGGSLRSKLAHSRSTWMLTKKMLNQKPLRYIPEWLLLPVWIPLWAAFQQVRLGVTLWTLSRHTDDLEKKVFIRFATLDCLRPFTNRNMAHFFIARNAVKQWNPSAFVTLYEGHPWESLAWLGCRSASKECCVIGYQHTVVLRHSIELCRRGLEAKDFITPDVLLCTGPSTETMLRPGHEPRGTRIVRFGSFRRNQAPNDPMVPEPGRRTVIVLPEGNMDESIRIFNFALQAALLLPDHHFIFRCHPMLPFNKVQPFLKMRTADVLNVEISNRELIGDDFARSSVILYRGSSAVFYALLFGLKPIYIEDSASYDMDPLFELSSWRMYTSSPEHARNIMADYARASSHETLQEWQTAANYVQDYTQAVDPQSLDRLIMEIPLNKKKVA